MLTTFDTKTGSAEWIGYQVIFGAGCGLVCHLFSEVLVLQIWLTEIQGLQVPLIAIQRVLPETQVAEGTSIIIFLQTFGGSIFLAVAQSIFNNKLVSNVIAQQIPVSPGALLSQGATQLSQLVGPQHLDALKVAYNESITQVRFRTHASSASLLMWCRHCTSVWQRPRSVASGVP